MSHITMAMYVIYLDRENYLVDHIIGHNFFDFS